MPKVNWAEVAANGYAVPEGVSAAEQVPELLEMLGHPDPVVRDQQAYVTLAEWLEKGHLDGVLRELGDECAMNLSSDNVRLRSFSALILAGAVSRQRKTGLLKMHLPHIWYACWERWYSNEPDVRSYDDQEGWIHTVAHGADFAREWALYQRDNDTLRHLTEHLHERIRTVSTELNQSEDDRLALAYLAILTNENFEPTDIETWSEDYRTLWTTLSPGKIPPGAVLAMRTLHSLHTLLHLGATINGEFLTPAYPEEALAAVQDALRSVYPYYGKGTEQHSS